MSAAGEAQRGPEDLRRLLERIDGRGYGGYKQLQGGRWTFPGEGLQLEVERVQADPFAPPSRLAVTVPAAVAAIPDELWVTPPRRRAIEDYLARQAARRLVDHDRASPFLVDVGRQEVLQRSTCRVDASGVRLRLGVQLPARGRTILGRRAAELLVEQLPRGVAAALRWSAIDQEAARAFVACVEDAVELRGLLEELGLVAFVADGAVLPRRTGVDDRPLRAASAVAFRSPTSMRVEVTLPNAGRVTGMGVAEGVTLIVGGGFHGKSTLLRALERGVYDHVPGDGRELVVTRPDAVKIRAEDGRRVERVDVRAFVGELPTGADTTDFSTDNASGSTSQAANFVEALECGARLLLVDEDTAATNLMIRDLRMQQLVAKDREPLTPFIDLVRPLHREWGVSTILVVGGSGDYFDVADRVVTMDAFVPREVTTEARRVAAAWPGRRPEAASLPPLRHRIPDPGSLDPRRGGKTRTRARGVFALQFGEETIDHSAVDQLVDPSQTVGIGAALTRLARDGYLDGSRTLAEALVALFRDVEAGGIDVLRAGYPGDLALPRLQEVAAALNRLRSLRVLGFSA